MIVKDKFLVASWLVTVSGIALMIVGGSMQGPDGAPSDLLPVGGLMMSLGAFIGAVLAYRYARNVGFDPAGWALAALLMPWLVPLVLALMSTDYKPARSEKNRIRIDGNRISIRKGRFRWQELPLDALRINTLMIPGDYKSRWNPLAVNSFQSESSDLPVNLDLLDDGAFGELVNSLPNLANDVVDAKTGKPVNQRRKMNWMGQVRFFVKDYDGRSASFSMKDVMLSDQDILGAISVSRPARIERLRSWLASNPGIMVGNSLMKSGRATLDRNGIRVGKNSMAWADVAGVKRISRRDTLHRSAFVVAMPAALGEKDRKRVEKSLGSLGVGDWFAVSVPFKELDSMAVEFFFWKSLRAEHRAPAAPA